VLLRPVLLVGVLKTEKCSACETPGFSLLKKLSDSSLRRQEYEMTTRFEIAVIANIFAHHARHFGITTKRG
jgi:hypothetical protein